MKKIEFDWIDAFSPTPFGGNGCAVFYDNDQLWVETCCKITRETGLSECTFIDLVGPIPRVRYFLANREIPFAGHPTIASALSLFQRGVIGLGISSILTGAGEIPLKLSDIDGHVYVRMQQNAPQFLETFEKHDIAQIYGIDAVHILATPQVVSTGLPFVIVLIDSLETMKRLAFSEKRLVEWQKATGLFGLEPFLVTLDASAFEADTFSRLLLPAPLPKEDPFTGSATGAMAAYLWHHDLLASPKFRASQGQLMGRAGFADVDVLGTPDSITGVLVAGTGANVFRGEYVAKM